MTLRLSEGVNDRPHGRNADGRQGGTEPDLGTVEGSVDPAPRGVLPLLRIGSPALTKAKSHVLPLSGEPTSIGDHPMDTSSNDGTRHGPAFRPGLFLGPHTD